MLRFFFKHFRISDKKLRMWCFDRSGSSFDDFNNHLYYAECLYNFITSKNQAISEEESQEQKS